MIHATWHRRYQPGVTRVIYNFTREIIGLKNGGGYPRVNLYCPGEEGRPLDGANRTSFSFFLFPFFLPGGADDAAVVHFVSLREK